MGRFSLLVFLGIISLFSYCNSMYERPNVIAIFKNLDYDTALMGFIKEQNREEIIDTVLINDGVLEYTFNGSSLHEGIIIPFSLMHKTREGDKRPLPSSRIRFFINPKETIKLNIVIVDSCAIYSASGNNLSTQIAEERNEKLAIFKDGMKVFYRYNQSQINEENERIYWQGRRRNDSLYFLHSVNFINSHPSYEYSARLWIETTKDRPTALRLYNKLDPKVKETFFGKLATSIVNSWSVNQPGTELPNFSAETIDGEKFELKSYRGKFVLLDFWGSWCAPCIVEVPKLKKVHDKWHDNLIIISLACNDKKESVARVVEKYQLQWIQLYSESNDFPFLFGVREYPTKILLNPDGLVVKLYDSNTDKSFFDEVDSLVQSK